MKTLRITVLTLLVGFLGWFNFAQVHSVPELLQITRDLLDPRPARHILILGNSRTYFNDMPVMLRFIADSAGAPQKYEIHEVTPSGSSLEILSGDPLVKKAIGRPWDDAILQAASREQLTPEGEQSFQTYGAHLIQALHVKNGPPHVIVNWAYDPAEYPSNQWHSSEEIRSHYYGLIQDAHAELARTTGARLVNVGKVWEVLRINLPRVPLTLDGNHPTPAASYFVALSLYADLSGEDVDKVHWQPDNIPPDVAARVREVVSQHRAEL